MEPAATQPLAMHFSVPQEVMPLIERFGERAMIQALRGSLRSEYERELHKYERGLNNGRVCRGAIEVEIEYYMDPPKALQARVEEGEIVHASGMSSPDICKLNETVIAALQNVVFGQKCQITSLAGRKAYCTTPHTEIHIRCLTYTMPIEKTGPHGTEAPIARPPLGTFIPLGIVERERSQSEPLPRTSTELPIQNLPPQIPPTIDPNKT